jgi:hypothetical protein
VGLISSITEVVVSGLTWAINKIVSSGAWFMAALVAFMSWITGTLTAGIVGLIQPLVSALPPASQGLTEIGLWAFGLFVVPIVVPTMAGLAVRFVIRRIPVIG